MGLTEIRQEIDKIDNEMKSLFEKRMAISEEIIKEKIKTGDSIYKPDREKEIVEKRSADVPDAYKEAYKAFVRTTIGLGRKYQYTIKCQNDPDAALEFIKKEAFKGNFDVSEDKNRIKATFGCEDGAGSLANFLNIIGEYGISINVIESKKLAKDDYRMLIIIKASISDVNTLGCLYQLICETKDFKILDIYTYAE